MSGLAERLAERRIAERMAERRLAERGSALVTAILLVALAGILATALAELGRLAVGRARLDRDGVRAWFLAEAGLADTLAGLPAGWSFTSALRHSAASPPGSGPAWTYGIGFSDDADDRPDDRTSDVNARVVLRVYAFGPQPVRRRLEAILGRQTDPALPGALTLGGDLRSLTADFLLDGRDFDMSNGCASTTPTAARAGLVLPAGAGMPMLARADQVVGRGGAPSIERAPAPAFDEVATDARATRVAAGPLAATLGDTAAPRFTRVDGDATVDATTSGVGALYVAGRLRITGRLDFRGLVAAAGGIELAPDATLQICGGAWAASANAFDARGTGFVRASTAALRLAATLAPLPAAARVIALREAS